MRREQGMKVSYVEAERLAREFVERMEQEKIFVGIDRQTWALRYPNSKRRRWRSPRPPRARPLPPEPLRGWQPLAATVAAPASLRRPPRPARPGTKA